MFDDQTKSNTEGYSLNKILIIGLESNLHNEDGSQNKTCIQQSQNHNDDEFEENISGIYIPTFKAKQSEISLSQFRKFKAQGKEESQENTNTKIQQASMFNSLIEERFKQISSFTYSNTQKKDPDQSKMNQANTFFSQQNKQNSLQINEEEFLQSLNEESNKPQLQKNNSLFLHEIKASRNFQESKYEQSKVKNELQNKVDLKLQGLVTESTSKTIKNKLFKFKLCKKDNYIKSLGLEKKDFQFIEQQVDNIIDYSKIIEELAFLKKAVMVILNKDQLAALKFVGCSKNFIKQIQHKDSQNNKMSYFEEQFAISFNQLQSYQFTYLFDQNSFGKLLEKQQTLSKHSPNLNNGDIGSKQPFFNRQLLKQYDLLSKTSYQAREYLAILDSDWLKKRTVLGALLTISIISVTIFYLIEILIQFFSNQIDPTFKNQTFIANGEINVHLQSDYFAYQLSQNGLNPINELEKKQNNTYVVAIAQFVYQDNTGKKAWKLKTIQCQNPKLNGYICLDFSNVPSNFTIALDNSYNIYSYVMVMHYRCQDTDGRKTSIPDNCANLNEIDAYIDNPVTYLKVQIQVSQYNTTSKQIETCYRSQALLVTTANIAISELQMQQQSTTVKQGAVLQTSETFNSPISYTVNTQMFDPNTIQKVIGYENTLIEEQKTLKTACIELKEDEKEYHVEEPEATESVFIPTLKTKQCESILSQMSKLQEQMKDEVKEDLNQEIQLSVINSQN
ncbi:hypothetical protein ABPG73_018483 [Tetrahymena malaccensis]